MKKRRVDMTELMTTSEDVKDYTDAEEKAGLPRSRLELQELPGDRDRAARFRANAGGSISRRPHIESLLGGALVVAMHQLNFLLDRVKGGEKLSLEQEREFHKLSETITKLTRAEREQRKAEGIDEMDLESAKAKLPEALEALGLTADDLKKLV